MIIGTIQGSRSDKDRIVTVSTYGTEKMSLNALLHMIQLMMENEDRLHPKPEKGRWLLFDAISEVANGGNFDDVARYFTTPKHIRVARELIDKKMREDRSLTEFNYNDEEHDIF